MRSDENATAATTVKTVEEQDIIRRAAAIVDIVFDEVLETVAEGVTERELAEFIRERIKKHGGDDISFDTIVAFGASGAEPHHVPTDKPLESGVFVTVDMGAVYKGYCSDFTRTFAFGETDEKAREVYSIVLEAYNRARAGLADGARCGAVDALAREYIDSRGYGADFIHGTGHGVGRLIHEAPTLNAASEESLQNGDVVTVEPGIYLKEEMGVRIENMFIVGEDFPLSRHSVELLVVDPDRLKSKTKV